MGLTRAPIWMGSVVPQDARFSQRKRRNARVVRRAVLVGHYTFADYPNGGLRASAYDLARFVAAHLQGGSLDGVQILAPETVAEIFTEQASRPAGPQGWMWYQSAWSGENWWGHGGAEKGVWTETFFRESDTMGFVVLTNGDANNPYPLYDIEDALLLWAESLEDAEL